MIANDNSRVFGFHHQIKDIFLLFKSKGSFNLKKRKELLNQFLNLFSFFVCQCYFFHYCYLFSDSFFFRKGNQSTRPPHPETIYCCMIPKIVKVFQYRDKPKGKEKEKKPTITGKRYIDCV